MTDYTTRDDTNLGVGRIWTSPTAYALYNNAIAITEGALGAPRIQTAAIQDSAVTATKLAAPTAGTNHILLNLQVGAEQVFNVLADSYLSYFHLTEDPLYERYAHVSARIILGGTVTASLFHAQYTGATNSSFGSEVRILKNGVVVGGPWFNGTTTLIQRSVNIAVIPGDLITFQQRATRSTEGMRWSQVRLTSGVQTIGAVRA